MREFGASNIELPVETGTPPTPAAGRAVLGVRRRGGRNIVIRVDENGEDIPLQDGLLTCKVEMAYCSTGANSLTTQGNASNPVGTITNPDPTSTDYTSSQVRTVYTSAATAGSSAGVGWVRRSRWRGNAARRGGFDFKIRFSLALAAGHQALVGLTNDNNANLTSNASGRLNSIGIGADAGDTNLSLMVNGASGLATKVPLTIALAKTSTDTLFLRLTSDANGSSIGAYLLDESTNTVLYDGAVSVGVPAGVVLPLGTVFLTTFAMAHNGAAATATAISVMGIQSLSRY